MQDLADDRDAGIPGLSDVPFVGNLFKHKKNRSIKSELVILLKPIVVDSGNQWSGALDKTANTLNRMKNETKQGRQ